MTSTRHTLEIGNPVAVCGHCRYTTELTGTWTVENNRLVFRASADPQPRRGPDLHGCCESSPAVEFTAITVNGQPLSTRLAAALQKASTAARISRRQSS